MKLGVDWEQCRDCLVSDGLNDVPLERRTPCSECLDLVEIGGRMTAEEQLAHVMDEYGVPPGDTDERLVLVLVFWQENHEEPPSTDDPPV